MNDNEYTIMEQPDWQHLKKYGYARGNYMSKCRSCGELAVMDKRAITCRVCAKEMYAEQELQLKEKNT
jgi:hypothetical protein